MIVKTPKGTIEVKESGDSTFPGVVVSINGVDLVLVEFDSIDQVHAIRVWDHKDPDNNLIYKQVIEGEITSDYN